MKRREFLKGAAALGAFNIVPAKVLWGATAPSNQLTRALIGFGEIAHSANHLPFQGSRLVGLTDCYAPRVAAGLAAAEKCGWGKIKGYKNFIELINDPDVDIVHICTPPHWHGVQSVMAAKAGKDVWCEKPMTRTVGEGVRVKEVIKAEKRMFRLNTWFRFKDTFYGFGTTVEPIRQIVENGLLGDGPLKCVFGEGQGFSWKFGWSGRVQDKAQVIPEGLDWDMWLGPAPWKPYSDHRFGTSFRGYWDYDSGGLGDMAQHYLDPLQYLLCKDETSPVKIDYKGLKQHPEAVGSFDRFTLTYADGTEVILDGDVSLRDEPLLRGSNVVERGEGPQDARRSSEARAAADRLHRLLRKPQDVRAQRVERLPLVDDVQPRHRRVAPRARVRVRPRHASREERRGGGALHLPGRHDARAVAQGNVRLTPERSLR